jgi:putative ABC transport system permease protein
MGIRKVFGSKPAQIYQLLIREYVPLLLVAIVLGSVAALILYKYMPGTYKYQMQPGDFIYAWCLTIIFTLLTISFQAIQVAISNPIKSLRYE